MDKQIIDDEYLKVMKIETSEKMNYVHLDLIDEKVNSMNRVELMRWHPDYFKISYYTQDYDASELLKEFEKIGIKTRKPKKKSRIHKLLRIIAKENKRSFGEHRLDCCDLNRGK